ncbi:MAG: enoyl-CoA hydratase/isomerase family protein, partial [Planctomycetes bacterium]|nr:enoyl-CoA hydratase/isomerase family protein [Planctomycetota bacterium]
HFSFGASVDEHTPDQVGEMLPALHAMARELRGMHVPVLIAARGMVLGGGLELLLLGDLVFAAPDAKFGQPEIQLGVFAPLGSTLLPSRVGEQAAADLLLSGRTVDAAEARELGLVRFVADDPGAAALEYAREHLVPKSASSLRYAVRALRAKFAPRFDAVLNELEDLYLQDLMDTHDAVEGIQAFLEKRAAKWEDR